MRLRPCLIAAVLLPATGLWLPALRADIQNPGRSSFPGQRQTERQGEPPPTAVPQKASVAEGGTVAIILRARGHAGEMIDFLIRTPPEHGTLEGEPRQLTLNTAEVIYRPRPDDPVTVDSFTYAVQARGTPVSVEATVSIRIQEPPPVLAVSPPELDFGAVKAGESTRAEVTLTNQGGGEAVGRLEPPPPWEVEGPAAYRLGRGMSQTFTLVFKPQGEHAYVESIHVRYDAGSGVRLIGTGLAGPGQGSIAGGVPGAALGTQSLSPRASQRETSASNLSPANAAVASASDPGVVRPVSSPASTPGVTRLEPAIQGGASFLPTLSAIPYDTPADEGSVTGFEIRDRGRSTLDLAWRVPNPVPKGYRVELRYLSLDPDDRLVVDWRPYAQVEYATAHGFVNARLSGLSADTQECIRIVAVDASGRLTTPSPLLVTYTLPASTWWRPTPLKVLFALLVICGTLVLRQRWETNQLLRSIDESRRRTAMT